MSKAKDLIDGMERLSKRIEATHRVAEDAHMSPSVFVDSALRMILLNQASIMATLGMFMAKLQEIEEEKEAKA